MARRRYMARRTPPHVTGAASSIITGGNPANPDAVVKRKEDWQPRVDALIDAIPEAKGAASYVHNSLSRVKFTAAGITDENIRATLDRQLSTYNAGRLGENIFRVGEGVIAYEYNTRLGRTQWWDYSIDEFSSDEKKPAKIKGPDGKDHLMPAERKAFRVWRPHNKLRFQADSNHRALQDVLEALYIHQLADNAVATSRLAGAGLLYVPNDELTDAPEDTDTPEPGSQQAMARSLAKAMMTSVKDRKVADAVVPFLMFGSAENAEALRHVLLERQDDAKAFASRMDKYRDRYASGIDLPAEIVVNIADLNHWNAWKVDENTWTYYLEPQAKLQADALERNFVEPVARAMGYRGPTTVEVDGSDVISAPDKTDAAIKLRNQGTITREAAAKHAGFDADEVETGPDPVLLRAQGDDVDEDGLPVGVTQSRPAERVTAALVAALSPAETLEVLSEQLMELEADTYDTLQRLLLRSVPEYLKAQSRRVNAASRNPDEELMKLATSASVATQRALRRRIRILSRATGADFDELLARYTAIIDQRAQAVAQASTAYAQYVAQTNTIQQAREEGRDLGRFEAIRLTPATVGGLTSIVNGGTADYDDNYLSLTSRPADFGHDEIVQSVVGDAGIEYVTKYRWTRGDPENPFEPHVDLEGQEWTRFADATFLDNAHLGFNPAGVWFPNDHVGCQCQYEITLEPITRA